MKLQHETITYNLQEALDYLEGVVKRSKVKTLNDGEFLPEVEHILWHINFAFNARYLSRAKVSRLKQVDYEKYLLPPKEIFERKAKYRKNKQGQWLSIKK